MLKKTITFENWNGESCEQTFFFNLTRTELAQLEYSHGGGLTEWIKKAVETRDGKVILATFEEIIKATYGEKSLDGMTFIKNDEIFAKFKGSPAYDVLYIELVTDGEKAAQFILDCMPKDLRAEAAKQMKDPQNNITKVES